MIILDTINRRLRILLGGAGAIPFLASYVEITTAIQALSLEASNPGVTNGTTPVDLVGVPAAGVTRQVKLIWIKNSTGAAVDVTIRYDDNGTNRDFTFTLSAGDSAQYNDGEGWRYFDSTGHLKSSGGGVGGDVGALATQLDYDGSGNVIYFGIATWGSLTSAGVWSIRKLAYSGGGNLLSVTWANGSPSFTNIWDNRGSLSYS